MRAFFPFFACSLVVRREDGAKRQISHIFWTFFDKILYMREESCLISTKILYSHTTLPLLLLPLLHPYSPPRKRSEDNNNHNHNNTVSSLANDMGPIPDSLMAPFAHSNEKNQHEDADDQDDFVGGIGGTMGAITLEDELLQLDNKFNNNHSGGCLLYTSPSPRD